MYLSSSHAEKRIVERANCFPRFAKRHLKALVEQAELLGEFGNHRYLRYGNLFFPCTLHWKSHEQDVYVIKSVLRWDMVKHRFQRVVDKYEKDFQIQANIK